uniref:protocadherin-15 n=1 Tax=Myxine glutinosa TaxID=7769 RepID=UPI00358E4F58
MVANELGIQWMTIDPRQDHLLNYDHSGCISGDYYCLGPQSSLLCDSTSWLPQLGCCAWLHRLKKCISEFWYSPVNSWLSSGRVHVTGRRRDCRLNRTGPPVTIVTIDEESPNGTIVVWDLQIAGSASPPHPTVALHLESVPGTLGADWLKLIPEPQHVMLYTAGRVLDRDPPYNIQSLQALVVCSNLRLGSSVSHEVKVLVRDINDNPPTFRQRHYEVSVNELAPVGTTIFSGFATAGAVDIDDGANGQIEYSIANNVENLRASEVFYIPASLSGHVVLQQRLNYERETNYRLLIQASDRALPPTPRHVSTATLLVTITDGDDLGPAFLPCQPITGQPDCAPVTYQTVIPRHAQPEEVNPLNVTPPILAEDQDRGMPMDARAGVLYSLLIGSPENFSSYLTLNPTSARLSLLRPIEGLGGFTIVMKAEQDNGHPLPAYATLIVNVLPQNLAAPSFTLSNYQYYTLKLLDDVHKNYAQVFPALVRGEMAMEKKMVDKLTTDRFQQPMKEFAAALVVDDPNAEFRWDYMTMVSILLCFTRAQRDGSWDLHLYAFKCMLPFLFSAEHLGQVQMKVFVDKRLCEPPDSDQHLDLKSPVQKNKAKTFAALYKVVQFSKGKQNTIKVDRNILQRLITAYRAGREVNLENILQHEPMTDPLSLDTTSGCLHSTNKSVLAKILTQKVQTPANVTLDEPSCLVIDGQALVMALGKSTDIRTFGDYADTFANIVFRMGEKYQRIDVVFDRYQDESIKAGTRIKRKQRRRPLCLRDTDVLLLLLAHYDKMGCTRLYMKAGMSKAPKYFPVHEIRMSADQVDTLLAFHAVTGCDSVSQFSGHVKETAWQVFQQHHTDLIGLGKGPLTEKIATSTEKFICKIYGVPEVDTCNKARVKLFCIGRAQETLPPTSDAAKFHIMRSHYQASVWNQAHSPYPDLPPVTEMGWMHLDVQVHRLHPLAFPRHHPQGYVQESVTLGAWVSADLNLTLPLTLTPQDPDVPQGADPELQVTVVADGDELVHFEAVPAERYTWRLRVIRPLDREMQSKHSNTLSAADLDEGENGLVRYSLLWQTMTSGMGKTWGDVGTSSGPFAVEESSGDLWVSKPSSLFPGRTATLSVEARDQAPMSLSRSSVTTVSVVILPPNNQSAPTFSDLCPVASASGCRLELTLSEGALEGTDIFRIRAVDQEGDEITYRIISGDPDGNFMLDNSTAILRLRLRLDRETKDHYDLLVTASDGHQSGVSQITLDLKVTDINDNSPQFEVDSQTEFNVTEGPEQSFLATFLATDADSGDNARLTYLLLGSDSVVAESHYKPFFIYTNGSLFTDGTLDREKIASPEVYITLVARDNGEPSLETHLPLKINVLDINDNPPSFSQQIYHITVPENQPPSSILLLSASDPDLEPTLTYLQLPSASDRLFSVSLLGQIATTVSLDFETAASHVLSVTVRDGIGDGEGHTATATVVVRVTDQNDFTPEFLSTQYTGSVLPDSLKGTRVLKVSATDQDDPDTPMGQVQYFVAKPSTPWDSASLWSAAADLFAVHAKTGQVTCRINLNQRPLEIFELFIVARDGGDPVLEVNTTISILILQPSIVPRFSSDVYRPQPISELSPVGMSIIMVTAMAVNQTISYSIVSGDAKGQFRVHSESGVLWTARDLDFELDLPLDLVLITVTDENDHAPLFLKSLYLAGITETTPPFSNVIRLQATDADSGNNSALLYSLVSTSSRAAVTTFLLESQSGLLKTARLFGATRGQHYSLQVSATDLNGQGLSGSTRVLVVVANEVDTQVLVSAVTPTNIEENKEELLKWLRRVLQAQVPGAELVVAEIGPKRSGDAFQHEDYTGSDLTIFAVDPLTKQPVPGVDLHKYLSGKLLDLNSAWQEILGPGSNLENVRYPRGPLGRGGAGVGYSEGALIAISVLIVICAVPATLILIGSYRQFKERQAECAKNARIQAAMPTGKTGAGRIVSGYEEADGRDATYGNQGELSMESGIDTSQEYFVPDFYGYDGFPSRRRLAGLYGDFGPEVDGGYYYSRDGGRGQEKSTKHARRQHRRGQISPAPEDTDGEAIHGHKMRSQGSETEGDVDRLTTNGSEAEGLVNRDNGTRGWGARWDALRGWGGVRLLPMIVRRVRDWSGRRSSGTASEEIAGSYFRRRLAVPSSVSSTTGDIEEVKEELDGDVDAEETGEGVQAMSDEEEETGQQEEEETGHEEDTEQEEEEETEQEAEEETEQEEEEETEQEAEEETEQEAEEETEQEAEEETEQEAEEETEQEAEEETEQEAEEETEQEAEEETEQEAEEETEQEAEATRHEDETQSELSAYSWKHPDDYGEEENDSEAKEEVEEEEVEEEEEDLSSSHSNEFSENECDVVDPKALKSSEDADEVARRKAYRNKVFLERSFSRGFSTCTDDVFGEELSEKIGSETSGRSTENRSSDVGRIRVKHQGSETDKESSKEGSWKSKSASSEEVLDTEETTNGRLKHPGEEEERSEEERWTSTKGVRNAGVRPKELSAQSTSEGESIQIRMKETSAGSTICVGNINIERDEISTDSTTEGGSIYSRMRGVKEESTAEGGSIYSRMRGMSADSMSEGGSIYHGVKGMSADSTTEGGSIYSRMRGVSEEGSTTEGGSIYSRMSADSTTEGGSIYSRMRGMKEESTTEGGSIYSRMRGMSEEGSIYHGVKGMSADSTTEGGSIYSRMRGMSEEGSIYDGVKGMSAESTTEEGSIYSNMKVTTAESNSEGDSTQSTKKQQNRDSNGARSSSSENDSRMTVEMESHPGSIGGLSEGELGESESNGMKKDLEIGQTNPCVEESMHRSNVHPGTSSSANWSGGRSGYDETPEPGNEESGLKNKDDGDDDDESATTSTNPVQFSLINSLPQRHLEATSAEECESLDEASTVTAL